MKTKVACQYAIVRFIPYAETGEFANVGVVLACPELGFLKAKLAPTNRTQRVTDFFQGLGPRIYREAMKYVRSEIVRIANAVQDGALPAHYAFDSITRPREALMTFSATRVILADSPDQALTELYERFIERDFATKEYHEQILTKGVGKILSGARLKTYFDDLPVGDDSFSVKFPFVSTSQDAPKVVIKPLFLGQDEPNKIFEHGGIWVHKVARLKKHRLLPQHTLFAIEAPVAGTSISTNRLRATREITEELRELSVEVVDASDRPAILHFAEKAVPRY
ncbi:MULTISPECIES: DUF3037 domain-containing protein [unclassified Stenotrophomonas]|uniref:DUF3037 domain-containing protein n=1 Tax=unclassified Stenotrophomonas TaxID=196198 RepID=UPI0012996731|nr:MULTISPECIES: DUF3037 domain-containing protein [unclassified Stenotrophomonas]UXB22805.1 DUF3037 domain-containing protein [Stenotrophomonas maltophilia]MRE90134.1 DUF3037 domain-containing protein [Stenotrophomonas sp. M37]MRF20326.1 DUF3037 domain-containing protein [Stenotrophomonas sp. MY18]MRF51039.1 DUF3037 domain-containing protein [Stenotrophomonas sp. MY15]MRG14327.1 DUF3037 domain-containing protein [Stenotrophomonas sp. MY17]